MSTASGLDAVLAGGIEDRHQPHDAAVAFGPAPGKAREGDALARDGIDLATDVLEAADPGRENRSMAGLPFGKILQHIMSRALLVILADEGQQTVGPTRAVRPDGRAQWVIERLGVGADHLHLLGGEPFAGLLVEPGRVAVVLLVVAVVLMPDGIDDDDIARLDF